MYIDRIDLSIPPEELQSIMEAFASAAASLELLPSVSPSDRKRYAKLGLKNEALALQIIEVGRANRHLIPAGLDFEKIDRDLLAREQLRTLKVILQGLLDQVSDSMLLTGVDLYAAALSMYHCLRRNADTASLKTTVAELKKGFARPSRKKEQDEESAEAAPEMTSVPQPVAQRSQPVAVAQERASARTTPPVPSGGPAAAAVPEHHAPLLSLSTGRSPFGAAPALHFSTPPLPHLFSGGFMPSALMYVYRELPQQHPDAFLNSPQPDGRDGIGEPLETNTGRPA